jgi:hypothetical protein
MDLRWLEEMLRAFGALSIELHGEPPTKLMATFPARVPPGVLYFLRISEDLCTVELPRQHAVVVFNGQLTSARHGPKS